MVARGGWITIAFLLAGTASLQLGNGMLGSLLPIRMSLAQFSPIAVGVLTGAYFTGMIAGVFLGQNLISRVGHIRAFAVLTSCMSAATLLHPFAVATVPWCSLRLIEGFCMAGLFMCVESWLNERSTDKVRGQVLSLYIIVVYAGMGLGQLFLIFDDKTGFGLFILVSVLVSLAVIPIAGARVQAPPMEMHSRINLKNLYYSSPLGVIGAVSAGINTGAFYGLAPYICPRLGLSIIDTALFMSVTLFGGLLLQWPVGKLSDSFDRRYIILFVCIGTTLVSIVMALTAYWLASSLILLAPLFGVVLFSIYPLSVAHTNDRLDRRDLLSASGGLHLAYGLGAVFGPVGASIVIYFAGPSGLFAFIGSVTSIIIILAAWRIRKRTAAADEEKLEYRSVPRTTPVAAALDPRTE